MSALDRCKSRLALREWLLKDMNVGEFPPSGAVVTGIERRIQLFPFTKTGSYNVRTVGSLDVENFFCTFQDIDPKGTGVLRPDDIPTALGAAVELLGARMDGKRSFQTRSKAYPASLFATPSDYEMDICNSPAKDTGLESSFVNVWRDLPTIWTTHLTLRIGRGGSESANVGKYQNRGSQREGQEEYANSFGAQEDKILQHVRWGLDLNSV
ncbi:hypothetical protein ScPMuIL_015890 [Solemya velum]